MSRKQCIPCPWNITCRTQDLSYDILLIKKDSFPQSSYSNCGYPSMKYTMFGRKIWNRNGLQKSCSINLPSAYRKKPPWKQDHAIGITSELFYKRHKTGLPLFKHPQWKALNRLLSERWVPFLSWLCSVFSSAAVSMVGFIPSTKNAFPCSPNTHFFPSSSFSLDSPPSLIYTRVIERFCSSLQ